MLWFALLIATAIQHIKGKVGYRLIFFLPIVASSVGVSMIWLWILEPNCGILNYFLECIKLGRVNLLGDTKTVMLTIGLIGIWCNLGYNVVIYIAGLEGVSRVYYEAAMVDGCKCVDKIYSNYTSDDVSHHILYIYYDNDCKF